MRNCKKKKAKWIKRNDCDHEWKDIGFGQSQCNYTECQMIKSNCSLSDEP